MRAACAKQSVSECKYRNRRNGEEKRCAIKPKRGESIFMFESVTFNKWEKTTNIAFWASFPRVFCWDCLWKYWVFFVTCLSQIALRTEIWKVFHFGHVVPNSRCVFEYLANISTTFLCWFLGKKPKKQDRWAFYAQSWRLPHLTNGPCCPFALIVFKFPVFSVHCGCMLVWFCQGHGGRRTAFIKGNTLTPPGRARAAPLSNISVFPLHAWHLSAESLIALKWFLLSLPMNILHVRSLQLF